MLPPPLVGQKQRRLPVETMQWKRGVQLRISHSRLVRVVKGRQTVAPMGTGEGEMGVVATPRVDDREGWIRMLTGGQTSGELRTTGS